MDVFQRAQTEDKPIGLRTNRDKPSGLYVGYVGEFNEKVIQLKSVSKEGLDDGIIVVKLKDVFGVEFNDRYLQRLDLLYKSEDKPEPKTADSADTDPEDEDFMIRF